MFCDGDLPLTSVFTESNIQRFFLDQSQLIKTPGVSKEMHACLEKGGRSGNADLANKLYLCILVGQWQKSTKMVGILHFLLSGTE